MMRAAAVLRRFLRDLFRRPHLERELDAELRNLFGRGLKVGSRYTRAKTLDDVRVDLNLPSVLGQDGINLAAFRRAQVVPGSRSDNHLTERSLHLQSQMAVGPRWRLLYGYQFERSVQTSEDLAVPIVTDVAGLEVSSLNDTRDNLLDARRGRLLTFSIEYSPPVLAKLSGNFNFVKGMAQLLVATPLGEAFTWAHGYRLGLAHGFKGQHVPSFERFKAGGLNTVRGVGTDALGPLVRGLPDEPLTPLGGEAVAILNQELRYRHARSGLGGVVFYDGGEVFDTVSELSLKLRHSVGFGLRWESPVGLLRVDLGFPLRRHADREEKARQLFLSIGQAF